MLFPDDKKNSFFRLFYIMLMLTVAVLTIYGLYLILKGAEPMIITSETIESMVSDSIEIEVPEKITEEPFDCRPVGLDKAVSFKKEDVASEYCVLLDSGSNTVIAKRNAEKRMYPASMTKVMTMIVAVENMTSLDDTFIMPEEIMVPLYEDNASMAGFQPGEKVTMRDLLYGAILPSGADATAGIAIKIAGSEKNFVGLMNRKARELELSNTNFVNTSGLHDNDHYTSAMDMAVIMKYALRNDICREILSTYKYTTARTKEHPNGIELESTMFSRMYGNEVKGVTIKGGKTGYTDEAQHTMVSFAEKNGREYILVVAHEDDKWGSVRDTFDIYEKYI